MANSSASNTSFNPPGMAATSPLLADSAYDAIDKLPPSNSGPKVSAAQYTSTRCVRGRGRRTRQMSLSLRSMVSTSASAVTNNTTAPVQPILPALPANWPR